MTVRSVVGTMNRGSAAVVGYAGRPAAVATGLFFGVRALGAGNVVSGIVAGVVTVATEVGLHLGSDRPAHILIGRYARLIGKAKDDLERSRLRAELEDKLQAWGHSEAAAGIEEAAEPEKIAAVG
jgi:hypothetical protein